MTNSDFYTDTLRLIGVLSEIESASPEQGVQAMRVLNAIMADWEEEGVDIGYYEQTDLTDDLPLPSHARAGVKYFLAVALAPEYGKSVPPDLVALGDKFFSRLIRESVIRRLKESTLDHLPLGEGQWG